MEKVVGAHLKSACQSARAEFIPEATWSKIQAKWGMAVKIDKSSRRIDFAVNKGGKLVFIETNFYTGGGSKLKSTAGEYEHMFDFLGGARNSAPVDHRWRWLPKTQRPLRDYYDRCGTLMNLAMLSRGDLAKFLRAV